MKENRIDSVFSYSKEKIKGGLDYLQREYGKSKAFNTEDIDPVDKLYTYEKLMLPENQGAKQALIYKYGIEVWGAYEKQRQAQIKARGL